MTFPLSSAVNVGDATEVSQYNNLRKDALYLGNDPAASGNLLQLLYQSTGPISLTRISGTTIQLNASADEPCALVIGGVICVVTANLTVLLSSVTLPAAGRYYVYAVGQSNGSFILSAANNTPANSRRIGTFLWDGIGIVPGTLHNMSEFEAIRAVVKPSIANGRLTLASGIPVPEADITEAEVLYFTPYNGNEIALYIGGEWEVFEFSELSLSLSGLMNELPYDIFISAGSGGLSLSAAPWGTASARLTTLVYFDGVQVSAADPGKRYLGSIALNASGKGEDSAKGRLLWNENNRAERPLLAKLTSGQRGTAVLSQWVPYYETGTPEVRLLVPNPETSFELTGTGISTYITDNDGTGSRCGITGIGRDIVMTEPYDSNTNCVPIFTHSYGNSPMDGEIRNYDPGFRGYHRYTLIFFSNYTIRPSGTEFGAIGAGPGLHGVIMG